MSDIIKMDQPKMEAMSRAFRQSAQITTEVIAEIQRIGAALTEGALLGTAGDLFADGVNSVLMAKLNIIQDKFEELDGDVLVALDTLFSADDTTATKF